MEPCREPYIMTRKTRLKKWQGLQWTFTMEKIRKYKACRKKNIMYPSIVKLTSVMLKIL